MFPVEILYYFSMAAVTNYHTLGGLDKLPYSPVVHTSLKSRFWQLYHFLEALGENPYPGLFQLLEAAYVPSARGSSSSFKSSKGQSAPSHAATRVRLEPPG